MTNFSDIVDLKQHTKEEILIAYNREMSRRSLIFFFRLCMKHIYTHVDFVPNWHMEELCRILQERTIAMEEKRVEKHLLVNIPIRALKTTIISEIFPCWLWVRNSSLMIQNICATQRLATKSSRMSKLILTSLFFKKMFPEIQLSMDNKSKSDYSTTTGGHRTSFGIDSSIIGTSYDICIIDDANDPSDSLSDTSINNVISVFKDVISGRANNDYSWRCILQQRTSQRDLCGYLLTNNANDYKHLCIPAELTKDTSPEFVKFYVDGLFFPSRYSHERLATYARELTSTAYASQILQSPSSVAGTAIQRIWVKTIRQSEFQSLNKNSMIMFIDTNMGSDNKSADPNGIMICCVVNKKIYVVKFLEKWQQLFELCQTIIELVKVYGIRKCYIENAAMGKALISELKRQLRGNVMVLAINPGSKSKMERVNAIQPYLVNSRFVLVEDDWNELFLNYLVNFPQKGVHDEAVDLTVYSILALLAGKNYGGVEEPEDKRGMVDESDFDLYS